MDMTIFITNRGECIAKAVLPNGVVIERQNGVEMNLEQMVPYIGNNLVIVWNGIPDKRTYVLQECYQLPDDSWTLLMEEISTPQT